MKTTKTLAILVLALGLMVCPAELAGAAPMGTGFTYQGRLVDDNSVANGQYDFQFKVFDNPDVNLGKQWGSTIYIYGLNVKDGNFTVELDFGSGIFTGDARWLEIGVRPGGSTDSFTILSPLQEVKPTPNSIHATHALQADEADTLNGFDSTAFASVAHSHDGVYALIGHAHDGSDIKTGTVAEGLIDASIARDSEITWGNLPDIPIDFADGIDNIGGTDSDWTISGTDIYSGVAGNVGIGTSSPLAKLSVGGNGSANTGVYGSGSSIGVWGSGSTFGVYGIGNATGVIGFDSDTESFGRLGFDTYGVYGKGTYGGYLSGDGNSGTSFGLRAEATSTNYNAYGGHFTANAGGLFSHGIYIDADNTSATAGGISYGLELYSDSANGKAYGVRSDVGAGSGSTSYVYGIYSRVTHSGKSGPSYGMWSRVWDGSDEGNSYGIYSEGKKNSTDTGGTAYGGYFVGSNDRSGGESYGVYGEARGSGTNYGVYGKASGGTTNYAGYFDGEVRVNGNLMIYSDSTLVLELGTGLDYAEGFDVSESTKIDAGSVLIIDAENPGKLAISDKAYDTKVAGIAAGAKGMGSGVRLGSDEFDCDVALAGRVYCNVDATEATVEPGDLLTTSTTPGYAMKAADYMRAQGAILGKAMESLEKGQKGQILVLVTLQ